MGKDFGRLVGAVEVRVVLRYGIGGRAAVRVHVHPEHGPCEITAFTRRDENNTFTMAGTSQGTQRGKKKIAQRLVSPEPVHLLHVVQRDHAVAQDDVQEPVGAEQELAAQVLPV